MTSVSFAPTVVAFCSEVSTRVGKGLPKAVLNVWGNTKSFLQTCTFWVSLLLHSGPPLVLQKLFCHFVDHKQYFGFKYFGGVLTQLKLYKAERDVTGASNTIATSLVTMNRMELIAETLVRAAVENMT